MDNNQWLIDYLSGLEGDALRKQVERIVNGLYEDEIRDMYEDEMLESGHLDDEYPSFQDWVEAFERHVLPGVVDEYGWDDVPAKREAWNNWTDMLCKNDEITPHQYRTWDNPY